MENDQPLIHTTKGNVLVSSLEYRPTWEETDDYVKFIETYSLNGEIVKQSAHVYFKKGILQDALINPPL